MIEQFSCRVACPLACGQLISLLLYEKKKKNLFRMQSKYTLKRINYDCFPKKFPEAILPHNKRVAIIIISYIKLY